METAKNAVKILPNKTLNIVFHVTNYKNNEILLYLPKRKHFQHIFTPVMPEERAPIISFSHADIGGGGLTVIHDLNLDIRPGEFLYLLGKVGTGKTSIIKAIIADNPIKKGNASVLGFDLRKITQKEIPMLRRKMGVVFQDFQLLMDRNIEENLRFVLEATGWKDKGKKERRIIEVLDAVGMTGKMHKMPHQLSGGEQQRICIARALLNNPEIILADEPTANLDSETANGIMLLLKKLNEELDTAILLVTHNRRLCEDFPAKMMICENETCHELESAREIDFEIL